MDDAISQLTSGLLGGLGAAFGFIMVIIIIVGIIGIAVYVISSLALMKTAQKLNIKNPWLAWLPIGNLYLFGDMAFTSCGEQPITYMKWIFLGLGAGCVVIAPLAGLFTLAIYVLMIWGFVRLYQRIRPDGVVGFTILSAFFGVIPLLFMYKSIPDEKVVEEGTKPMYCEKCGAAIPKDSRFCEKCGEEVK